MQKHGMVLVNGSKVFIERWPIFVEWHIYGPRFQRGVLYYDPIEIFDVTDEDIAAEIEAELNKREAARPR